MPRAHPFAPPTHAGNERCPSRAGTSRANWARLSPDGSTIVYESAVNGSGQQQAGSALRWRDLATASDQELEPETYSPIWSADGRLAYGRTVPHSGGGDVGAVFPSRSEVRSSLHSPPAVWTAGAAARLPVAWAGTLAQQRDADAPLRIVPSIRSLADRNSVGIGPRVVCAVAVVNVVLIVAGIGFAPSTLRSVAGATAILGAIGMQVVVALLARVGPASLGHLTCQLRACLGLGAVFAVAYDALLLADFQGHPLAFSPWALFIGTPVVCSLIVSYRTRSLTAGVLGGIWSLVFGTALWSAGFMLIAYSFWGSHRAYLFWLRDGAVADFQHAGGRDFSAFLLQDVQGALFFHPLLSVALGLSCGFVAAGLGRQAATLCHRARGPAESRPSD